MKWFAVEQKLLEHLSSDNQMSIYDDGILVFTQKFITWQRMKQMDFEFFDSGHCQLDTARSNDEKINISCNPFTGSFVLNIIKTEFRKKIISKAEWLRDETSTEHENEPLARIMAVNQINQIG